MKELDSRVIRVGSHDERHTWYPGASDALGEEIDGYTGKEILVRRQVIKPVIIFDVKEVM